MITSARIREDLKPAGLDWITALRASKIQELADGGPLQLSLFDDRDLAEIASPDYPGERVIVCRNPLLAAERRRKREALLVATERDLIPTALDIHLCPRPGRDRGDDAGVVGKEVPSLAATIDDVFVVVEDSVGEFIGSQISPDVFERVQFRRIGRQHYKRDVVRHEAIGSDRVPRS